MMRAKIAKLEKSFYADGSLCKLIVKVKITDPRAAEPFTSSFEVCRLEDENACPVMAYAAGNKAPFLAEVLEKTRALYNEWIVQFGNPDPAPTQVFKTDAEVVAELGTSDIA